MAPGAEATKIITDALPPSPALRVLTYNLWFSEHKGLEVVREKRMRAVSAIIEDACPDVIFFQAGSYEQLHPIHPLLVALSSEQPSTCHAQHSLKAIFAKAYEPTSALPPACSVYERIVKLSCTAR